MKRIAINFWSIRTVVTGSAVLAILIVSLFIGLDLRERDQRQWVSHTYDVILTLRDTLSSVSRAEISVRGYLLSRADDDLAPYRDAATQIEPQIARLQSLVSDNPAQTAAAARAADLIRQNYESMATIVAIAGAGDNQAAADSFRNGADAALTAKVRSAMLAMQAEELSLMRQRELRANQAGNLADIAIVFMVLLASAWIYAAMRHSNANAHQRQMAERELADSEARYRLLADNSTDVIAHRNAGSDVMTYISPAVRDVLGREPAELMGTKWLELFHPDDRAVVDRTKTLVSAEAPTFTGLFRMRHADGRYIWIEVLGRFIPADGFRVASVQTTWRDITARKTAEEEAVRLRLEADKANKAKSEFLAMMSHELRTPMAGVLGIADLLLLGDTDAPEQQRLTKQLKRSALSLLDILNDILDFSKIEAGKLEIDNEPFSLGDVLADVRGLFGPAASAKGIVFDVTTSEGLPDAVKGDAKRLRQIMVNLANNAIKFTKQGRVDLRVEHKQLAEHQVELAVSVKDTGVGISPENIARLFQPFVQADSSTSRTFGGTGLGLTIARLLVSAMKGRIWVESELGHGATFFFVIPLATMADVLAPAARYERRMPADRVLRPLSILVAEDTDTVRQIVAAMLKRMSHTVDAVEHGAAGVGKIQGGSYDVILLDMQMPIMDGLQATKAIRAMEEGTGKHTPVIALTADAIHEHRERYLAGGVDAVVTKPINWDQLTSKLAELVPDVAVPPAADRRKGDTASAPVALVNDALLAELAAVLGGGGLAAFFTSFTEGATRYQGDIAAALGARDLARAKKAAHALKGLSSQMGADRIAAVAQTIEQNAASLDDIRTQLPVLSGIVNETLLALSSKYDWAGAR